jgi:hypothetical protein
MDTEELVKRVEVIASEEWQVTWRVYVSGLLFS